MVRVFSMLGLMALLMLEACGTGAPAADVLPTFVSSQESVASQPNQAYPTAQASESNAVQTAGGLTLNLQQAWRDGKQVYADVCFALPDESDWTVWKAQLAYGGETITEFSSSLKSRQEATNGQPAQRCDELAFYVPPDADLSSAQLTVDSLGAYPTSDQYCSLYMPKIQKTLNDRGIAITLACTEVNGTMTMQITGKPDNLSEDEAQQMVFSDEFYTIMGPWTFGVTISQ
jgi:hypothetical protein